MSGISSDTICPVCGEEMNCYTDYKPFDNVDGRCINCGFSYYTKVEQMDLEEINELREEFNENDDAKLKPMTQKEYKKWGKEIKKVW